MSTMKIAALWLILSLWTGLTHAGTHHYYYTDAQGTVLAKADANGAIVATNDYAPYGTAVTSMSPAPSGPGYTGHVNDPESGFVYMQARYYDPAVGRFLSVDPVGPAAGDTFGFARYTYANSSPINNMDPDGRYTCLQNGKPLLCAAAGVTRLVDGIRTSQSSFTKTSSEYRDLQQILDYLGAPDEPGKASFELATLPPNVPGAAPEEGPIQLDMNQLSRVPPDYLAANPGKKADDVVLAIGAGAIGHETRHKIDYAHGAYPSRPGMRAKEMQNEINAYHTESVTAKGLHINIGLNTPDEIRSAAKGSTDLFCTGNRECK